MWKHVPRLLATLAAAVLLAGTWTVTAPERAQALDPFTGYLMAHFTGESANGEQIYFAHSRDGLNWTDLNAGQPVLLSTVGTRGVRDPALVRSPNGDRYWIIATDLRIASGTTWEQAANQGSKSLVVWESTDLVNWSAPRLVGVANGISGAGDAWAPEAIYNPATGDYVVYWATNSARNGVTKHRIWYSRTSDFRTFTAPQVYIDRSGSAATIDTQIIEVANSVGGYRYYRTSADGVIASNGDITVEASNSILGSWTSLGNLRHLNISNAGFGNAVEGPMWMRFNGRDEWALWLDQYGTGRGYMPITSTNLGSVQNFRTASGYSLGSNRKRHGTILNLTAAEESRVLARWGSAGERVTNRHSGLVLDVQNPNTSNGAKVGQYAWNGGAWQQWKFEDAGSGYVRIRSVHSNKCLDVAGTANGAEVQQYDCHTGTNQQFTLRSTSNGYVQIVDRRSGRCLDVPGWSTANGTIIKIYDCNNGNNQQWLRAAA
ncbi:1,4-beta-xylanase [Agromyces intestinalis]|uniref:1,4-beta-xylanase n=1 Tax=Agromyces intestinalis TaxID=2592652 RepID=A0A5C1YJR0_9MICO|nr:RICIN domain-containing protein [Agromyces intestinalis]QEO15500.1 1,4-beta-xylanase [Agromyces intestinalis]